MWSATTVQWGYGRDVLANTRWWQPSSVARRGERPERWGKCRPKALVVHLERPGTPIHWSVFWVGRKEQLNFDPDCGLSAQYENPGTDDWDEYISAVGNDYLWSSLEKNSRLPVLATWHLLSKGKSMGNPNVYRQFLWFVTVAVDGTNLSLAVWRNPSHSLPSCRHGREVVHLQREGVACLLVYTRWLGPWHAGTDISKAFVEPFSLSDPNTFATKIIIIIIVELSRWNLMLTLQWWCNAEGPSNVSQEEVFTWEFCHLLNEFLRPSFLGLELKARGTHLAREEQCVVFINYWFLTAEELTTPNTYIFFGACL